MLCTTLAIGLHLATYHRNREAHFDEFNPGIYASCQTALLEPALTGGVYHNSEGNTSAYVGVTYTRVAGTPLDVTAGVVTGYKRGLFPLLVPSLKLHENVRLTFLPPIPKVGGAIHLSIERKF